MNELNEKKTYTLFQTDLRREANKEQPTLADIQALTREQVLGAYSILYIRPDGKRIFLKNRTPLKKKHLNRFEILKRDSEIKPKSNPLEFV